MALDSSRRSRQTRSATERLRLVHPHLRATPARQGAGTGYGFAGEYTLSLRCLNLAWGASSSAFAADKGFNQTGSYPKRASRGSLAT